MDQKPVRIFVGNLPPDADEDDVKNIMEKYATVMSVELKRRTDGLFAFVDLEELKIDLDNCLWQLSKKKWKGHQLRVQLARESFLQRLARERSENQNVFVADKNISADLKSKGYSHSMYEDSDGHNVGATVKRNGQGNENDNIGSADSESSISSDSSDSDVPTKGSLRMFRGVNTIFENEDKEPMQLVNSKFNSDKISSNKIHEEKEILEKFEMFNSVWKDEPIDVSVDSTRKFETEHRTKTHKIRQTSSNANISNKNVEVEENIAKPAATIQMKISKIKHDEAEKRRIKAIADRQKEILNRKQVIQFALASVDSINNTSRPNKKIVFADDDCSYEEENKKYSSPHGKHKLTLFGDDEMEHESNENDFRIRNHYEGEKGQALLSLQARYANDKRFTLDERFVESDDSEQEGEDKTENNDTQAERLKLLRILGTVLGKEIPDTDKAKTKHSTKMMLRYDPTKPNHTKFEIKQDSSVQKSKKKKTENIEKSVEISEVTNSKEVTENLPVVSKERYYEISETLKETLQSDQKFSFLEMFGNESENGNEKDDMNFEAKPIINSKKWSVNTFKNDSSASEDENEQDITTDYVEQNNGGVKQESLFFLKNDARFIEGLEFINYRNEKYMKNFEEIRRTVKKIVRHKLQNNRKNSEKWKTKPGGRTKIPPSKKRLKNNFRR